MYLLTWTSPGECCLGAHQPFGGWEGARRPVALR